MILSPDEEMRRLGELLFIENKPDFTDLFVLNMRLPYIQRRQFASYDYEMYPTPEHEQMLLRIKDAIWSQR